MSDRHKGRLDGVFGEEGMHPRALDGDGLAPGREPKLAGLFGALHLPIKAGDRMSRAEKAERAVPVDEDEDS